MKALRIEGLYDLKETIAAELMKTEEYPWRILGKIKDYILDVGGRLDPERFERVAADVWIAKSARVASTAYINGPAIIDEEAEVRHCAFIRGAAIVGKHAVVGNSTELKNVILFNRVQVPHFNYVGDSILGFKSHMGAGAITSNVKSDSSLVRIKLEGEYVETGLKKFGAMIGDYVEIGCNCVLNPGTVVGPRTSIYPLSAVRGVIPADSIYKCQGEVALRNIECD